VRVVENGHLRKYLSCRYNAYSAENMMYDLDLEDVNIFGNLLYNIILSHAADPQITHSDVFQNFQR